MIFNSKYSFASLAIVLAISCVSILNTGCNKDDDDDNNNNAGASATTIPPIDEADGVMVAIKTVSFVTQFGFEVETYINTAVAAFGDFQNEQLVDVGTVDLDANVLEKVDNNAYVLTPSATNPTGPDFGSSFDWNVTGGSGFGAFSHTVNFGFPSIGKITSATGNISSASPYTLSIESIAAADSVIYQIAGSNGTNVLVTKVGNSTSHTFTAAEVASVGKGTGIIQVAAYTYDSSVEGGKTIYYVNESVVTDFVEID